MEDRVPLKRLLKLFCLLIALLTLSGCRESDPKAHPEVIEQVEIKTFIVSRDQLATVFATSNDPVQLTNGELTKKMDEGFEVYLLMKITNHNDRSILATIHVFPQYYAQGLTYTVNLGPKMTLPNYYVSFINSGFAKEREERRKQYYQFPDPVEIEWEKLYVE